MNCLGNSESQTFFFKIQNSVNLDGGKNLSLTSRAVCCQRVSPIVKWSAGGLASAQRTTTALNGCFRRWKGNGLSPQFMPVIQLLLKSCLHIYMGLPLKSSQKFVLFLKFICFCFSLKKVSDLRPVISCQAGFYNLANGNDTS